MTVTKTLDEIRSYITQVLQAKGVPQAACRTVADSLAYADGRGTRSHGLNMLSAYLERIDAGGIDVSAVPQVVHEDASTLCLDAKNGFGQVGVQALVDGLLHKAEQTGVVCGSVLSLKHCGALAYYTEQCARQGYIAFLFVNANPTVAPFGGMEATLGTNPLSVALPNGDLPILLDMASSAVAKAKIYQAAKLGQKIDPSWALDQDGNPTDDPQKAISGVLTSMAGPKGYGIALVVEALAGVVSGAGITSQVSSVHKGLDRGMNAGGFLILINPNAFLSPGDYRHRLAQLVKSVKSCKPQPGREIFLPGEIEHRNLAKAKAEGVTCDAVFFPS